MGYPYYGQNSGQKIIGVTEGLLFKLQRRHIEAIVAHEAAHLCAGDARERTLLTSLFILPTEILKDILFNVDQEVLYVTRISWPLTLMAAAFYVLVFLSKTVGVVVMEV